MRLRDSVSTMTVSNMSHDFAKGDAKLKSACDVIGLYRDKIERGTEYIEINRMQLSLMRQLMRIYKNPKVNLKKHLDVSFVGEQGADMGGPTKEYFHYAISVLNKVDPVFNIQLFGGQEGHLIPLYGVDAISSGCFEMAGKLLAHSTLHQGPGLVGLSPALVKYLCTGSVAEAKELVTMEDLYDVDLRAILGKQVLGTPNVDDIDQAVKGKIEDLLVKHGLSDVVPLTNVNKEKAIQDLLVAEVLVTRTVALDAFFKGLNCLGLGDLLCKHQAIASYVLPSNEKVVVDPDVFKGKLLQGKGRKSSNGEESKNSNSEEQSRSWEWFLQFIDEASLIEDVNTVCKLLSSLVLFITGSTVLDLSEKFEVNFQIDPSKSLLEADRVLIPTSHQTYAEFKNAC